MVHYLNEQTNDVLLVNNNHFSLVVNMVLIYLGQGTINTDNLPVEWVKLDIPAEDLILTPEVEAFFKATNP